MTEPNLDELEDFVAWSKSNPGLTLGGYAYHTVSASVAIAMAKIFWPNVLMYEGGVFLADAFSKETFESWRSELAGDIKAIERAINHIHLSDVAASLRDLSAQNRQYLTETLVLCWRCRLKQAYPHLEFVVEGSSDPEGIDHEMTFWHND